MPDWQDGYVADVDYTYGYYAELNPLRITLAFLNAGLAPPSCGTACELGFGQGVSSAIHAAGSVTTWYGTDFNPTQAGFAQGLMKHTERNAYLVDQSFAEFCQRDDLPMFDYIALHGIWSWISAGNRAHIVDFLRRKLKVGGVLYISYNAAPGWASFAPLQHLMRRYSETQSAPGQSSETTVGEAIEFTDRLLATQPRYAAQAPHLDSHWQTLRGKSRAYVAHEYFNRDWQPMHFSEVAQALAPAKLQYACSAMLLDAIDALHLTSDQHALLQDIPDPTLRQDVRDVIINTQFRRDYWVKGAQRLDPITLHEQWQSLRVVLMTPPDKVPMKAKGALGAMALSEAVYAPLLRALGDHTPKSVAQLLTATPPTLNQELLQQALTILAGSGHVAVAQSETQIAEARYHTECLNQALMRDARASRRISCLASPVTGGGIGVDRLSQLFLLAREHGHSLPGEWAAYAWQWLSAQQEALVKDGQTLATAEANIAELTERATEFESIWLPLLKALGIARSSQ